MLLLASGLVDDCVKLFAVDELGELLFWAADDEGDFFQGWNPLPTAASASGGGDLVESLLHWAASIASGVPRNPGWSCKKVKRGVINKSCQLPGFKILHNSLQQQQLSR